MLRILTDWVLDPANQYLVDSLSVLVYDLQSKIFDNYGISYIRDVATLMKD